MFQGNPQADNHFETLWASDHSADPNQKAITLLDRGKVVVLSFFVFMESDIAVWTLHDKLQTLHCSSQDPPSLGE